LTKNATFITVGYFQCSPQLKDQEQFFKKPSRDWMQIIIALKA